MAGSDIGPRRGDDLLDALDDLVGLVGRIGELLAAGRSQPPEPPTTSVVDDVLQRLLDGGGPAAVVEVIGQRYGRTTVLHDGRGRILATSAPAGDDVPEPPGVAAAPGSASVAGVAAGARGAPAGVVRSGVWSVAVGRDSSGRVLATLSVLDPAGELGDERSTALVSVARAAALEVARTEAVADAEVGLWGGLARELLLSPDRDRAVAHAVALGADRHQARAVALVDSAGAPEPRLADVVRRTLPAGGGSGALLTSHGDVLVAVAPAGTDWARTLDGIEEAVGPSSVAVSCDCHDLADLPVALVEAEVARVLGREAGAGRVSTFESLGVTGILAKADPVAVSDFVDRWLGALRAYDREHRSEMVATLATHLACGGSTDAAAAELHVHRSTLKYRLGRIRELTGFDLSDPDIRFNLQLATRADTVLRTLRSGVRSGVRSGGPDVGGRGGSPPDR